MLMMMMMMMIMTMMMMMMIMMMRMLTRESEFSPCIRSVPLQGEPVPLRFVKTTANKDTREYGATNKRMPGTGSARRIMNGTESGWWQPPKNMPNNMIQMRHSRKESYWDRPSDSRVMEVPFAIKWPLLSFIDTLRGIMSRSSIVTTYGTLLTIWCTARPPRRRNILTSWSWLRTRQRRPG